MFCKVCTGKNKKNGLTKDAKCRNFQNSTLTRHVTLQEHQMALQKPQLPEHFRAAQEKADSQQDIAVSVLLKIAHWLCVEGLPLLFVIVSSDMINDIICKLFVIICHRICVIFLQDVTSLTCTVHSSMAIYDNELELEKLLCIVTKSGVWDSGA